MRIKRCFDTESTNLPVSFTLSHVPNWGDSSWEIFHKRLPRSGIVQYFHCAEKIESDPKLNHIMMKSALEVPHSYGLKRAFFPGKIDLSIKSDSNLDFQLYGTYQILFPKYFMPSHHRHPFWPVAIEDSQKRLLTKNLHQKSF